MPQSLGQITGVNSSDGQSQLVARTDANGNLTFITVYPGMEILEGDVLQTSMFGSMTVTYWDGSMLSVGFNSELTALTNNSQTMQSWIENMLGNFRSWLVQFINSIDPPRQQPSVPMGVGPGHIGELTYPGGTTSAYLSVPYDEWMGWDPNNYLQYDSYDGLYYGYWGGGGGGGGSCDTYICPLE